MSNPATQFKPGQSGNPAGKPPGTKSKINRDIHAVISAFINKATENEIDDIWAKVRPEAKLQFIAKLAPNNLYIHKGNTEVELTRAKLDKLDVSEQRELLKLVNKMEDNNG